MNNPFAIFAQWYEQAASDARITQAEAMNLATASASGIPSNRMVLLKEFDDNGFVFFTNLESHKGRDLLENPHAAICIYWEVLGRQIRIEGDVSLVSDEQADAYFNSRPLQSRVGAILSQQSRPMVESHTAFIAKAVAQMAKASISPPVRPAYWSGFRITPRHFEFWQNGDFRLHHRQIFEADGDGWKESVFYP